MKGRVMPTKTTKNEYLYVIDSTTTAMPSGVTSPYSQKAVLRALPSDVVVGSHNKNYKYLIARHIDATTGYSRQAISATPGTCTASAVTRSGTTVVAVAHGYVTEVPVFIQNAGIRNHDATRDMALKKLKSKLSGHEGRFKALIPLGEIGELRKTITSIAQITAEVYKDIRRLRITSMPARKRRQLVQQAWLTYSFGVSPLVSDAKNLSESIASFLHKQAALLVLQGSASYTWVESSSTTLLPLLSNATMSAKAQSVHEVRYTYRAGFNIQVAAANMHGVMTQFGLNLSDVPSALYELTAFSWIVDYFTTAGEFFADAFEGSPSTVYCVLSTKHTMKTTAVMYPVAANSSVSLATSEAGIAKFEVTNFTRVAHDALPMRSLRLKTVDEIGRNAVNRLLNLTSLLGGVKK